MKKTYITPAMEVVSLHAPLMTAPTSLPKSDDTTIDDPADVWSNQWQGGSWEYDNVESDDYYEDDLI